MRTCLASFVRATYGGHPGLAVSRNGEVVCTFVCFFLLFRLDHYQQYPRAARVERDNLAVKLYPISKVPLRRLVATCSQHPAITVPVDGKSLRRGAWVEPHMSRCGTKPCRVISKSKLDMERLVDVVGAVVRSYPP